MKRLLSVAAMAGLLLTTTSISWAANLNSSKSNIYRTTQQAACLEKATTPQAKAECEKLAEKKGGTQERQIAVSDSGVSVKPPPMVPIKK